MVRYLHILNSIEVEWNVAPSVLTCCARGHLAHCGGSLQTLPNSGPHAQMAVDSWMATLVGSWLSS